MSGFSEKLLVTALAPLFKISVIWFEYGSLTQVFKKNFYLPKVLYRLIKNIPKKILTISRNTQNALIPETRISLSKLDIIPPGVKSVLKNSSHAHHAVGSLSRLTPEKGQRLLLEAWIEVVEEIKDAKLILAGQGPDEEYLREFIQKHNLENSVTLLGFVKDKDKFFSSINVFVFSSVWKMEGFGMVMAEAMSYGLPIIAINNGPVNEIISDEEGVIVNADRQSLSSAIINLLKDEASCTAKGKNAKKRADESYNDKKQVVKIKKILEDIIREECLN